MCIQQWSITMIDIETLKSIGKRPTHRHNNQILNAATAKDDELDAQNAIKKQKNGQKGRGERCEDRTQQFNVIFLGAGLERERPDGLPIAASVRRTNGSSPPIDRTRRRWRTTSDAREHATTSLVFGGWRRDDRDDNDRDHDDCEGDK